MDYVRAGKILAFLRTREGLTANQLLDRIAAGDETSEMAPSTVYRAESGEYETKLSTIERWLAATGGPSLSDFFRLVENSGLSYEKALQTNAPGVTQRDTLDHRTNPLSRGEASRGIQTGPLYPADERGLIVLGYLLDALGAAIDTTRHELAAARRPRQSTGTEGPVETELPPDVDRPFSQ